MKEPILNDYAGGSGINFGRWSCPVCKFKHFKSKGLAKQHIRRCHE